MESIELNNLLISDYKPVIQIFYQVRDDPFICGICGGLTIESLQEIEKDCIENKDDYFIDGDGEYIFSVTYNKEQRGEYGYIEISGYWELDLIRVNPF